MYCGLLIVVSVVCALSLEVLADTTAITGTTVELKCQYRATPSQRLIWLKTTTTTTISYSSNDFIFLDSYPDIKSRVTITGNYSLGEYHLRISDVRTTDAGVYTCAVGSSSERQQLTIIEGPVSVSIDSKSPDNKLYGTEDQSMTISCTAVGGTPAPDMVLQILNQNNTVNSNPQKIQHTVTKVDRSYDGSRVTCLAGYQSISFFPKSDTATIYLNLKPVNLTISPDPVVAAETRPLEVMCASGGRPKPTVKWSIDNTDITVNALQTSIHDQTTDTYTVTSTLTYSFNTNDNGQALMCGFNNAATGGSYISVDRILDIRRLPDTPSNLSEVRATERTITFQWTPGFNEGQSYLVEYRVLNTKDFHQVIADSRNASRFEYLSHTLVELESGTKYDIRIFSRNEVGSSSPTQIVKMSTICSDCEKGSLTGVAVGLSTVIVISLVVNGVQAYRMFTAKKTNQTKDHVKPSSKRTSRQEVYYNVAENIDDKDFPDEQRTANIDTHEELGSKDKPNEYDELKEKYLGDIDSTCRNITGNYETLGKTDQHNVYDDLDQKPKDPLSAHYSSI